MAFYIWSSISFLFLVLKILALARIPKKATSILALPLPFVKWVSIKCTGSQVTLPNECRSHAPWLNIA